MANLFAEGGMHHHVGEPPMIGDSTAAASHRDIGLTPFASLGKLGVVLPARLFGPLPPLRVRPLLAVLLAASQLGHLALLPRLRILSPLHLVRAPPARILFTSSQIVGCHRSVSRDALASYRLLAVADVSRDASRAGTSCYAPRHESSFLHQGRLARSRWCCAVASRSLFSPTVRIIAEFRRSISTRNAVST